MGKVVHQVVLDLAQAFLPEERIHRKPEYHGHHQQQHGRGGHQGPQAVQQCRWPRGHM